MASVSPPCLRCDEAASVRTHRQWGRGRTTHLNMLDPLQDDRNDRIAPVRQVFRTPE